MSQEMTSGYRLSPEQTHLWMLRLFDRCAVCAVQIEGELRLEDLQRAIRHVVSRHEILRTAFKLLPGMTIPVQVISETPDFAFANHDFAELAVSDQDRQVSVLLADARERKAGYEQLPLVRVDLIKRSSRKHVLIISLPVICADVQSLQCLVSQIAAAYAVSSQTQPADVEVLQYADFAEWKNELREAEAGSAGQRYWRQHDLSELDTVKLSFEKRVGAATTFQPAGQSVDISPAVSAAIRMLASRCEISVSSFFLACWQILISRLTGQTKVVFGLGVEGRKFAELEQSIGLFATFVPVRSEFLPNLPFEKFVKQMSAQELEAQRYQEYFTWENAGSDEAGERFFPFSFEFHKAATSWKNEALEFLIFQREACTDRFKIKFVVEDGEDRFSAALQFDESLFSSDDVRRLADQLSTLVQDAANRTNAPLNALELLGNAERRLLLVDLNNTLRQYSSGKLVHELFEEQAQDRPNESAVVYEAERLTYRDLNSRANQLAHHLIKLGVGPDVTVGLCLERSTDLTVALLGIMKAGGAYVPLDPGLLKSRLKMILEEAGVRVLVTRSTLAKLLGEYVESVVSLDEEAQVLAEENSSNPPRRALEENLAYVIFTSGSTGRPKGVAVEHRQLANYVNAVWEKLELPEGGNFAMVSTISADLGNTALFPALCKKGTLHLIAEERSTNAEALANYFSSNQIDCLKIVPTHLSALLAAGNAAAILPRRRLILGGDASSWSLVERIRSLSKDCEILNHYGPTETTVGALTHKIQSEHLQWLSDTVPLGRPLGNVQTYILDEELRPVPIGAPGEVHIGGAGLARGYINRPDATAEKFIPNPFSASGGRLYKTGDRARYLGDGQIEFLGRNDNQVKVHGYRIELGEIEIALRGHEDVTDSIVIAREDIRGLRQLVAYLVPREGKKLTSGELRAFLNEKLPEYMVPTSFVFLERIPLTLNGKVDRNALPAPDHLQGDGDRVFTAPRTDVEKTLVEIWSNVLGLERVGVHDNFFDLGGDSILSIQIVARASQAGLRLMPRQLFQHQTVADLAAVVGSVGPAEQGLVTGRVPLTPIQARFFQLDQPELHHYNQAMLLEVKGRADAAIFEQAIELLLVQHDALRFRYHKNHDGWEQTVAAPERVAPFERIDLSAMAEAEQTTRMSEHAATLQASLNLQHGPLMRVVLFDRGQQSSYLLVVIHHLVVDGVSWRILLEDLHTLYQQLSLRQEPSLPAKTTSFKNWAQGLTEYAKSAELREELAYWCGQLGEKPRVRLPLDNPNGTNTVASARTISVSLNVDETRELLQALPVAYRTQVNEVLLTALVRAVTAWTKGGSALLDLEGHGREEIIDGVNLSRTVGWFTTIFPVLLDCKNSQVETLRSVKEQLRKIPNRGIGYGLLKYTADDANAAGTLRALPQAEMRFNYLGQIDRVFVDSPMFATAPHQTGPAQSPKADRAYLLNIIAMVTGGELRLQWTYSENIHRHETIQHLAESHLHELRMLIEQSRTGGESVYSPSDFPSANLTKEDLDKVLARMRR